AHQQLRGLRSNKTGNRRPVPEVRPGDDPARIFPSGCRPWRDDAPAETGNLRECRGDRFHIDVSLDHREGELVSGNNRAPGATGISSLCIGTPPPTSYQYKTTEEDQSPDRRYRFHPEVDARNLFRLYRLQKRKVRQDRSS